MLTTFTDGAARARVLSVDRATLGAAIEAAHARGLPVFAHTTVFPDRPIEVVRAGVDSVSHLCWAVWQDGSAFVPPPRVESTVLRLDMLEGGPRVPVADERRFASVVKAAFQQRRKRHPRRLPSQLNRRSGSRRLPGCCWCRSSRRKQPHSKR